MSGKNLVLWSYRGSAAVGGSGGDISDGEAAAATRFAPTRIAPICGVQRQNRCRSTWLTRWSSELSWPLAAMSRSCFPTWGWPVRWWWGDARTRSRRARRGRRPHAPGCGCARPFCGAAWSVRLVIAVFSRPEGSRHLRIWKCKSTFFKMEN